jgi:hypothetical protein
MIRRCCTIALLLALILPAGPAAAAPFDAKARDETARLAVAVLGRVCLLNLGDLGSTLAATAAGGEFGFVEAPPEVSAPLLDDRPGFVRVLRRPGLGAIVVVFGRDGGCSVSAEAVDALALRGYLTAMIDKGGLKGGAFLQPMGTATQDGVQLTDFVVLPNDWYARQLSQRLGGDGKAPVMLVTAVAPPGQRPMEAVLSVRPPQPVK